MPVTLVDRLPLPNLKAYTTGSVLLLSVAIYYAMSVTSDPNWRVSSTLQRQEAMSAEADGDTLKVVQSVGAAVLDAGGNVTRNFTEQFIEVVTFMMQEPLCMWTVINTAYCCLALFGFLIQRFVFGQLRVAEAQRVKDKFWNYVFYKFIFVFGVINVQYMDEVLLWCAWFTILGFLQLLGQLCKDRFDYLSSSPNPERWAHARLLCLVAGVQAASAALLVVAAVWGLPAGCDTFVFMAAECVLVLVSALHVVARYVLQMYEADVAGPLSYYTHLVFESLALVVELMDVVHMVVYSNMLVSMASLVLLMQLRHLLHELQARLRRHRLYTTLAHHMSRNYPMASKEEVEKNQDNCAICWEPMKEARKLPCSHLFHNSCLCQWVQQDASCPTCRRALAAGPSRPGAPAALAPPGGPAGPIAPAPRPAAGPAPLPLQPRQPNHLFHFDGSRYVSWLPSFSVEVTRVRLEPPPAAQLDAMARQVQQMFPQFPLAALARDLAATRSPDLTIDNILEGRLRAPTPPPRSPPPPRVTPTQDIGSGPLTSTAAVNTDSDLLPELHTDESTAAAPIEPRFSRSVAERQALLQQRKAQIVARARRRYLERVAAGGAASGAAGGAGGGAAGGPLS
ncbi:E3 ubiquitin-protein ligase AMFR [Aphomia sociella]